MSVPDLGEPSALDARTGAVVGGLSIAVFALVAVVLYAVPRGSSSGGASVLPALNAALNGLSAVLLLAGYGFIRRKRWRAHRACMISALTVSAIFLVSYLVHHAQVGSVRYQGTGALRALYLAILVPHVALAAPVVPLALLTIRRGWTGNIAAHRRIARITLPIWLYVSVSGVVIYWMLYG